jgi:hypothetical protein
MLKMKYRSRTFYTDTQKAMMWDRWRQGESLHEIARCFDRHHTESLLKPKNALARVKGTPLSLRIARGTPKSLKVLSNTANAYISRLVSRASQTIK